MELPLYEALCQASSDLFKNSLILPVGLVIARETDITGTITITEIRRHLGGRVEGNQIREALKRLAASNALAHLATPQRSQGHHWRREEHAFWDFVERWSRTLEEAALEAGR